jgi:hypothetical protein
VTSERSLQRRSPSGGRHRKKLAVGGCTIGPMDIEIVMKRLYESEINCSISSFWDGGWTVRLGDEMNGFAAETNCSTLDEAAAFLDREAKRHFPESVYALGKLEFERRIAARETKTSALWPTQP